MGLRGPKGKGPLERRLREIERYEPVERDRELRRFEESLRRRFPKTERDLLRARELPPADRIRQLWEILGHVGQGEHAQFKMPGPEAGFSARGQRTVGTRSGREQRSEVRSERSVKHDVLDSAAKDIIPPQSEVAPDRLEGDVLFAASQALLQKVYSAPFGQIHKWTAETTLQDVATAVARRLEIAETTDVATMLRDMQIAVPEGKSRNEVIDRMRIRRDETGEGATEMVDAILAIETSGKGSRLRERYETRRDELIAAGHSPQSAGRLALARLVYETSRTVLRAKEASARRLNNINEALPEGGFRPRPDLGSERGAEILQYDSRAIAWWERTYGSQLGTMTPTELRRFSQQQVHRPLTDSQRARIMDGLRKASDFDSVVEFYERSVEIDPGFRDMQVPREHYIVALNKTERWGESLRASERLLQDMTRETIGEITLRDLHPDNVTLIEARGLSGEAVAGVAKVYREISLQASGESKTPLDLPTANLLLEIAGHPRVEELTPEVRERVARVGLELSTAAYETGFRVDFDYYPGINAVYNHMRLGNVEHAMALAELVELATVREGGSHSTDIWVLSTRTGLALTTGRYHELGERLRLDLPHLKSAWQIETRIETLQGNMRALRDAGKDVSMHEAMVRALEHLRTDGNLPPSKEKIDEAVAIVEEAATAHPVRERGLDAQAPRADTFSFGHITSRFDGVDVSFEGSDMPVRVGRADVTLARQILARLGTYELTDLNQVSERVDRFVTGTRGPTQAAQFWSRLKEATGASEGGKSQSSVMAALALGTATGVQRDVARQLLMDVYVSDRLQDGMQQAYARGVQNRDAQGAAALEADLRQIMSERPRMQAIPSRVEEVADTGGFQLGGRDIGFIPARAFFEDRLNFFRTAQFISVQAILGPNFDDDAKRDPEAKVIFRPYQGGNR